VVAPDRGSALVSTGGINPPYVLAVAAGRAPQVKLILSYHILACFILDCPIG
jgi:hypothetical protein